MEKTIRELTGDLLAAPSACKEIKDAAQNYLDADGSGYYAYRGIDFLC